MGIWSCIGQDLQTVTESLKHGRSGIIFDPQRLEYGLRSGLVGPIPIPDLATYLPRRTRQLMSEDAGYAYMAARQAFAQASVDDEYLRKNEVGILFGNDGTTHPYDYARIMDKEHNPMLVGYNELFRTSPYSATISLSSIFHLRGIKMSISAACASSSHAIGMAYFLIKNEAQEMILAGGSNELRFDNISNIVNDAFCKDVSFNEMPSLASRPFDRDAIGCIPTGGAAALILEDYEHAINRGATILAEIIGYGFASDGTEDIRFLQGDAEARAATRALNESKLSISDISFIHSRADSFMMSDQAEAKALSKICNHYKIPITSSDAITGHGGGMVGSSKVLYGLLMLQNDFIAPTINFHNPIEEAQGLNIVSNAIYTPLHTVMITGAGIGGSYNAIVLRKI